MASPVGITVAQYNNALRLLYTDQVIEDLTNADNPALAMLKRETDFTGQSFPLPIRTAYSQSASASFASAYGNQQTGLIGLFTVTRSKLYDLATIQRETMKASADKKGAFENVMVAEVNGAIQNLSNMMAQALFGTQSPVASSGVVGNGTGVLGQIASISTGLITFVDPDSVSFFELNQVLRVSTTNDSNTSSNLRANLGIVIGINRAAGQITVADGGTVVGTPNWNTTPATPGGTWTTNDYVLVDGNQNSLAPGFAQWLPFVAPVAGDSLYGQDRSKDVSRLAGNRYDATNDTIEEAFLNATSLMARDGAKPDVGFVSTQIFNQLQKALQGRLFFIDTKVGAVGFQGLRINGSKGPVTIYQDRNAQLQYGYLLTLKDWVLHSLGGAPELQVDDFGKLLREVDQDAYQVRVSAYYAIECRRPVGSCVVKFAAP